MGASPILAQAGEHVIEVGEASLGDAGNEHKPMR
jgi:hypothetical protein